MEKVKTWPFDSYTRPTKATSNKVKLDNLKFSFGCGLVTLCGHFSYRECDTCL